ncbi:fungal hydrophobin-domain-containing protein [Trametes maxima]|nr:fungal hydrophobin-domain-containing protein [Trametes maxima]
MYSHTTRLLTISTFTILAAAIPMPDAGPTCGTSPIQCCDQLLPASDALASTLLGLVGVVVEDLSLPIGITCTSITGVGVGSGSACSSNVVCCDNNAHGTLISIGCIPIIIET